MLRNSNPLLDFTKSLSFVDNSFRLWCAYHYEHEVTCFINKLSLFIIRQMNMKWTCYINKICLLIYESIVYINIFHFCDRCGHWTSCWYQFPDFIYCWICICCKQYKCMHWHWKIETILLLSLEFKPWHEFHDFHFVKFLILISMHWHWK